jgi:phosphatidylserine decarboxylase precursor
MILKTKNSLRGFVADKLGINRIFRRYANLEIDSNEDVLVSPVEAKVKTIGKINSNGEIMSKGDKIVKLESLLGEQTSRFADSSYINFYLNPFNKHYWVTPYDGTISYIKKREGEAIFPVLIGLENLTRISMMNKAVKRNASISTILETKNFPIAMIAVGSLNVNRIHADYVEGRQYVKGDECGYFSIGSSMLLCFPNYLETLVQENDKVRIGQMIIQKSNQTSEHKNP